MWAIHDRFIPIQEGWMQYYSLLTQKGLLPYRDFYFFTQPIPLFIAQLISKFGNGYMLYRYYGMVERSFLVLVLYYLIAKHFSPAASFIAVVTSAFLYQSFNIDILYTYYQTALLFFFLSLICLQRGKDSQHYWLYDCFAGFFASLAFFTKQSCGLFASLFLLFLMVWYTPRKILHLRVISFLLGWIIPAFFIVGWLIREHIYFEYLKQVFGGISSKGSILDILFAFWSRNSALWYFGLLILGSLTLFLLVKNKKINIKIEPQPTSTLINLNYFLIFIFPVYIAGGFLIPPNKNTSLFISYMGDRYLLLWLYFTFFVLTITTIIIGIKWISRKQLPFSKPLAELILASFVWTYSTGLSGQLEFYSILLGTALVLAFLFDRLQQSWKPIKLVIIMASCLVLFVCSAKKNQMPYDWWGWIEYGHSQNVTSIIPAFKDFKLSAETVGIYDKIYLDIEQNTTSNDFVYTYPFLTLFNYVSDRMQPTFSPVHYFDVCPDYIAIMDAAKLRDNPPRMIIYMEVPAKVFKLHEDIFRNGQPSGQRQLLAAIEEIIIKYHYKKIDSFVSPGWNWHIYVWFKP